jgi:hypothetical protein
LRNCSESSNPVGKTVERGTTKKVPLGWRGVPSGTRRDFGEGDFNVDLESIINIPFSYFKGAR